MRSPVLCRLLRSISTQDDNRRQLSAIRNQYWCHIIPRHARIDSVFSMHSSRITADGTLRSFSCPQSPDRRQLDHGGIQVLKSADRQPANSLRNAKCFSMARSKTPLISFHRMRPRKAWFIGAGVCFFNLCFVRRPGPPRAAEANCSGTFPRLSCQRKFLTNMIS